MATLPIDMRVQGPWITLHGGYLDCRFDLHVRPAKKGGSNQASITLQGGARSGDTDHGTNLGSFEFTAVYARERNLGNFTKGMPNGEANTIFAALDDPWNFQFGLDRGPGGIQNIMNDPYPKMYTLPFPGPNDTKPSTCIMLTGNLFHTTFCWKVVKVRPGCTTLAVAHVDALGSSYKRFHKMVKDFAQLEVMDFQTGQIVRNRRQLGPY